MEGPMNILYVDMLADIAGHTRTATTIAAALARRGHTLTFAVTEDSRADIIEAAGFPVHRVPAGWAGQYPALERLICRLRAEGKLDVVHAFDKRGLPEAARAAKALGVPVFHTICGGKTPTETLEMGSIISLSHEVKHELLERTGLKDRDIEVIPARLDLTSLREQARSDTAAYARFRTKYGLPPAPKIVLRIARLSNKYKESVLQGADAVAQLHREGHNVCFVHIGFVPPGGEPNHQEITARFEALNHAAGTTLAVTVQDEAAHAPDYVDMADAVIGMGRTVFEGMLFEKPTLIVSDTSFAGLIGRDDTDLLAFYNFSGRHLKEPKPYVQSVNELADTLREVFSDDVLARRVGEFGRAYALDNLDAAAAAARYEARYRTFSPDDYPSNAQIEMHIKLTPKRIVRGLMPKPVYRYFHRIYAEAS